MDEEQGVHTPCKILGIECDVNYGEVATTMENSELTKRGVVSAIAKFFDPLKIVLPVTAIFKMFSQQL